PQDRRALAAEVRIKQAARLRQVCVRPTENLGEANRSRQKDCGVPAVNDPDIYSPSLVFESAEPPGRKTFGMQRAIDHLKCQVGNLRSSEANAHDQIILQS